MKRFQTIVSPLSLSDADQSIIAWTSKVTRLAEVREGGLCAPDGHWRNPR